MRVNRFWNWADSPNNDATEQGDRILRLEGVIAPETWLDDEITPAVFKEELNAGNGPVTVWINSVGGDCVAAAQIYNMLMEYPAPVTVKIDGIAASAASVIAMAGTTVLMSPVSTMMIHNPATVAIGDHTDMEKAIEMLGAVKDSIINAYEIRTGLTRKEISRMMDAETWFDAHKAVELGFADGILQPVSQSVIAGQSPAVDMADAKQGTLFSRQAADTVLVNKLRDVCPAEDSVDADALYARLEALK
jgi:ATP-dependent Clp protease protease subunit